MAKRRNLKKEKAYGNRRRFDDNRLDETEGEAGKGGAEDAGGAAE
jgi:hypothetical protein